MADWSLEEIKILYRKTSDEEILQELEYIPRDWDVLSSEIDTDGSSEEIYWAAVYEAVECEAIRRGLI